MIINGSVNGLWLRVIAINNIMENFTAILLLIVAAAAALLVLSAAAAKSERVECLQWQAEAREFAAAGYYLTAWQAAQCTARGVNIDAPVIR